LVEGRKRVSVGISEVSKRLLDKPVGLASREMAVVVDIELVPNLLDVGFDLLFWDLFVEIGVSCSTLSVLLDALWLQAHTETLSLSSVKNQLVCQIVNNLEGVSLQLFNIKVLNALMLVELSSWILLVADLAHDKNFWAVSLDMIMELGSGHMLELGSVADITSELGAVELSVCLELTEGLPDDLAAIFIASMWELTEINAVLNNLVNFLEEITTSLAIGAANVITASWSWCALRNQLIRGTSSSISTGRHHFVINFFVRDYSIVEEHQQ
jgi:hypothetical protein